MMHSKLTDKKRKHIFAVCFLVGSERNPTKTIKEFSTQVLEKLSGRFMFKYSWIGVYKVARYLLLLIS